MRACTSVNLARPPPPFTGRAIPCRRACPGTRLLFRAAPNTLCRALPLSSLTPPRLIIHTTLPQAFFPRGSPTQPRRAMLDPRLLFRAAFHADFIPEAGVLRLPLAALDGCLLDQ